MADKTPGRSLKKSGKSIKERRAERRTKADTTPPLERLTHARKP